MSLEDERGQSLVEFAFVLPLLLLTMVLILDLGLILYGQMAVSNAAWEGARAGATIVNPENGDSEIEGAALSAAYGLPIEKLEIDIDPQQDEFPRNQPFPSPRGSSISVMVIYRLRLLFPPVEIPLTGKAVTRMEYQNP